MTSSREKLVWVFLILLLLLVKNLLWRKSQVEALNNVENCYEKKTRGKTKQNNKNNNKNNNNNNNISKRILTWEINFEIPEWE